MAITHYSEKQKGIIYIVWDGEVVWEDWLRHLRDIMADPDCRSVPRFIADLQSVTNTSTIQAKEVELAAVELAENSEGLPIKTGAVVATKEFRRAHKFLEILKGFGASTVVFNTVDTACLFLGIDSTETRETIEQLRSQLRRSGS